MPPRRAPTVEPGQTSGRVLRARPAASTAAAPKAVRNKQKSKTRVFKSAAIVEDSPAPSAESEDEPPSLPEPEIPPIAVLEVIGSPSASGEGEDDVAEDHESSRPIFSYARRDRATGKKLPRDKTSTTAPLVCSSPLTDLPGGDQSDPILPQDAQVLPTPLVNFLVTTPEKVNGTVTVHPVSPYRARGTKINARKFLRAAPYSYGRGPSPTPSDSSGNEDGSMEVVPRRPQKHMFGTFNQSGMTPLAIFGKPNEIQQQASSLPESAAQAADDPMVLAAASNTRMAARLQQKRIASPSSGAVHCPKPNAARSHSAPEAPRDCSSSPTMQRPNSVAEMYSCNLNHKTPAPAIPAVDLATSAVLVGPLGMHASPGRQSAAAVSVDHAFGNDNALEGAIAMEGFESDDGEVELPLPSHVSPQTPPPTTPNASAPSRSQKGKERARNAEAGPSSEPHGRPPVDANQEIERVGHRMQAELVELAEKHGLAYTTLLRKIGFGSQQEVRMPNLANIFRKVHKHRLLQNGEPTQSVAQHNAALAAWQRDHGDDPDAVTALLQEHAQIVALAPISSKPSDIPKRVASISQQMADMSNSYFMANNIVVIGAVMHLGATHASQTFAPNMGQQIALVNGFQFDQEAVLLKAKALLLLQSAESKTEEVPGKITDPRWLAGPNHRDDYRNWVRAYLRDAFGKATEGSAKWNPKKFPDFAVTYGLVLTGWGPNIRSTPTREWTDRKAGSLTQANWWDLVQRIPHEYKSNPHHLVLAGEMSLEFITIEEYLQDHPEHAGRQPCVVDHRGRVLHFAGEDKVALAGTAPDKARRGIPFKPRPVEVSDDEFSSGDNIPAPDHHYIPTGALSPSGNIRKRARVGAFPHPGPSSPQQSGPRPVKSIPARYAADEGNHADDARKRKRSAAASMHSAEPWSLPDTSRPETALGPPPLHDRGGTSMFQPSGLPAPFSMQPPYVGHTAFSGPAYQPPYYPPHAYGQQGWPPMNLNNAPPQWPSSNPYNQEDMDPFLGLRRGGFGNGQPY